MALVHPEALLVRTSLTYRAAPSELAAARSGLHLLHERDPEPGARDRPRPGAARACRARHSRTAARRRSPTSVSRAEFAELIRRRSRPRPRSARRGRSTARSTPLGPSALLRTAAWRGVASWLPKLAARLLEPLGNRLGSLRARVPRACPPEKRPGRATVPPTVRTLALIRSASRSPKSSGCCGAAEAAAAPAPGEPVRLVSCACGGVAPSISSSKTRSGSSMSFSRRSPSGKIETPSGSERADERARRVREQHVAAVPRGAEPGGADDVEAEVPLAADRRLAGVQPHPHEDGAAVRPVVRGVGALHLDGRLDRVAGAREGEEERVALRVDLDAAALGERVAHQPAVVGEDAVVALAELLQQRRRALDVAEDEGDGAARERGHAPSMQSAWQARGCEPARRGDQPLPAPARRQPGRLVPLGRGGARARARDEDRPILLSIGYAACHWCHVMEHESFEDAATAAVDERALRQRQGRPRGAPRPRRGLHGGGRGAVGARRLADDGLPHAGRRARSTAARTTRPSRGTACRASVRCSTRSRRRGASGATTSARRARSCVEAVRRLAPSCGRRATRWSRPCSAPRERDLERDVRPAHGGFGSAPKFPHAPALEFLLRREGDAARAMVGADARRDGRRRDVRPARRRLPPLLGRRPLARAALREDALRQRAAGGARTSTAGS